MCSVPCHLQELSSLQRLKEAELGAGCSRGIAAATAALAAVAAQQTTSAVLPGTRAAYDRVADKCCGEPASPCWKAGGP